MRSKATPPGHDRGACVFSEMVRALRLARGLTQQQLADRLGKTKGTVAGCETGRNSMQERVLVEYARALGYPDLIAFLEDGIRVMRDG